MSIIFRTRRTDQNNGHNAQEPSERPGLRRRWGRIGGDRDGGRSGCGGEGVGDGEGVTWWEKGKVLRRPWRGGREAPPPDQVDIESAGDCLRNEQEQTHTKNAEADARVEGEGEGRSKGGRALGKREPGFEKERLLIGSWEKEME